MRLLRFFIGNLGYILGAYIKYVIDIFRGSVSDKARYRMGVCKECGFSRLGICLKCGCVIAVKTNMDYIENADGTSVGGCPVGKW